MTTLETGDAFPDITLPDHRNVVRHISSLDTARGYAKANNVQLKWALEAW